MAKNLRPGPKWIPAVIVERLGPLSYLVESNDCDLWRRHVDLLKELSSADRVPTVSTPHSAVSAEVVLLARHRPLVISGSVPEPAEVTTLEASEAPISGAAAAPTATPVRVPSTAVVVPTSLPQATETSTPTVPSPVRIPNHPQVPTQSYPSRNRKPPDYFRPVWEIRF